MAKRKRAVAVAKKSSRDRDEINHVASIMKQRRVLMGKAIVDVAADLGVAFQQIQKYEKGTNGIPAGRVRALCRSLDVTPNALFGYKGTDAPLMSKEAITAALELEKLPPDVQAVFMRLARQLNGDSNGTI